MRGSEQMKIIQVVRSGRKIWPGKATAYVSVAILMMLIVSIHSFHFAGRNFREDEINTIHAAKVLSSSQTVQWLAVEGFHPPGWRLVATAWVKQFGMAEPMARYMSTLFTLLTLAVVFRLGADLFDRQVGLIAVLIIGMLPFFHFFSHELRPYSALVLCVAGMQ